MIVSWQLLSLTAATQQVVLTFRELLHEACRAKYIASTVEYLGMTAQSFLTRECLLLF
jgi:hypothetical protein